MTDNLPRLVFSSDFDARAEAEVEDKGWFDKAVVYLPNGRKIRVSFWDPVRLAQDLETDRQLGHTCLAEPGMIVVPKVTVQNMQAAVLELFQRDFFDHLESVD